ncbi:MAG: thymidine phosphorylase, partial [Clostridium sartagoforme]|nr:thymidine phosphorylase [Clostridium sartagoforme]
GQTGNIAPADKKLYALRDVTATVDNMSLIASSIMSKKIASGADAIVLDVKVGDGAFMKTPEEAKALAREMVDIGTSVGRKTIGIISDMNQPLGYAIGNALEVKEAISLLKGNGPKDLLELTLTLGSYMLICAKKVKSFDEGKALLLENIENGKGIKKLKEFVEAQGGDSSFVDDTDKLPKAKYIEEVRAITDGVITKIHAEAFGLIAMELGAGRETKESDIDLAVGIVLNKKINDEVKAGDILAYIHSNSENNIENAKRNILKNIIICDENQEKLPLIYDIVQ